MDEITISQTHSPKLAGSLVYSLLSEIAPSLADEKGLNTYIESAKTALESDAYWAFVAYVTEDPVAFISVSKCCAIYSEGEFGEIAELYVAPNQRSKDIGGKMLEYVINFAERKNWPKIEVGAPSPELWGRTISFYKKHGFREVGPRLSLNC